MDDYKETSQGNPPHSYKSTLQDPLFVVVHTTDEIQSDQQFAQVMYDRNFDNSAHTKLLTGSLLDSGAL